MTEGRPKETLVQYDEPIEAPIGDEKAMSQRGFSSTFYIATILASIKKKTQLPPLESKPATDDILSAILPPREWVENGRNNYENACRSSLCSVYFTQTG